MSVPRGRDWGLKIVVAASRCCVQDGKLVKHSAYRTFISYQLAEKTPKGKLTAAYIFELVYAILAAYGMFQVHLHRTEIRGKRRPHTGGPAACGAPLHFRPQPHIPPTFRHTHNPPRGTPRTMGVGSCIPGLFGHFAGAVGF